VSGRVSGWLSSRDRSFICTDVSLVSHVQWERNMFGFPTSPVERGGSLEVGWHRIVI